MNSDTKTRLACVYFHLGVQNDIDSIDQPIKMFAYIVFPVALKIATYSVKLHLS